MHSPFEAQGKQEWLCHQVEEGKGKPQAQTANLGHPAARLGLCSWVVYLPAPGLISSQSSKPSCLRTWAVE